MKIPEVINNYLEERSKTVSPVTVEIARQRLDRFVNFLSNNQINQLEELTSEKISTFQEDVEKRRPLAKTQYADLYEPKRFLKYLYETAYTIINLSENLILPRIPSADIGKLSVKDAQKVIDTLESAELYRQRDKAIGSLFLIERISPELIRNLSVLDLNLEEEEIRLTGKKEFKRLKKETLFYLRNYLRNRTQLNPITDWVFVNKKGIKIAENSFKKLIRKLKRERCAAI